MLSMKAVFVVFEASFLCLLLVAAGCQSVSGSAGEQGKKVDIGIYADYGPAEVYIMPLTEFTGDADGGDRSVISVYVSVLDTFDCQVRWPGVFRFELYEYLQRSANPKGRRIFIWPDIDLTESGENNSHWRDFLRAYEFSLDYADKDAQGYVLQVTYHCPASKRLSAEFSLKVSAKIKKQNAK